MFLIFTSKTKSDPNFHFYCICIIQSRLSSNPKMGFALFLKKAPMLSSLLTRPPPSFRCVSNTDHFQKLSSRLVFQKPYNGIASLVPERVPTLMYFDLKTLTQSTFKSKIDTLVHLSHLRFKDFPCLLPILPESKNAFFEIDFKYEKHSFSAVYGRFNFFPVALKAGRNVFVLDSKVFQAVPKTYADPKHFTTISRGHSFSFFETKYSHKLLVDSLQVLATGKVSKSISLTCALSRFIGMTSYSCFLPDMREIFEYMFLDPSLEFEIPDDVINLAKKWGHYSREIHLGSELFDVEGKKEPQTLDQMRKLISLLNSKREDRRVDFPVEKKWNDTRKGSADEHKGENE